MEENDARQSDRPAGSSDELLAEVLFRLSVEPPDEEETARVERQEILEALRRLRRELAAGPSAEPASTVSESVLGGLRSRHGEAVDPGVALRQEPEADALPADTAPAPAGGAERRYRLLGEIARGGMGIVLKSRDADIGRTVALKVLRPDHADDTDKLQRFLEECQIGGQLQHPGIVPVYELGRLADGRPFFTMRLIVGRTLAALLRRRGSLMEDRSRFLSIFEQICQTVAYAHSRGVIHRDLKATNVMVGPFGEVMVIDWGLAKVLHASRRSEGPGREEDSDARPVRAEGDRDSSIAGRALGTPAYMPPEQARGELDRVDERSDVFTLGAILGEILTGEPPYLGTRHDRLRAAVRGDLTACHERLEACSASPTLVRIARSCLAPDPESRPRDAREVARAVAGYFDSVEEHARKARIASTRAERERTARRHTTTVAAMVILALFIASATWLAYQWRGRQRRAEVEGQVAETLEQASLERGRGSWEEALASAGRIRAQLATARVGEAFQQRARELIGSIESEALEARRRMELEEQDEILIARLESILTVSEDRAVQRRLDGDFAQAFREFGVKVDDGSAADTARWVRQRSRPWDFAVMLDAWARVRRRGGGEGVRGWRKLLLAAQMSDPDPVRDRVRSAFEREDAATLAGLAREAPERDWPSATAVFLGAVLVDLGEIDAAIAVLRDARLRFPRDRWVNHHLGAALLVASPPEHAESARCFEAVVALRPELAVNRFNLGYALLQAGDFEAAEVELREAIRLDDMRPHFHGELAAALTGMGNRPAALDEALCAVLLEERSPRAQLQLGRAQLLGGNAASARISFEKTLELHPGLTAAQVELARARESLGDDEGALSMAAEAAAGAPGDAAAHRFLGGLRFRAGQWEDSRAALERAMVLDAGGTAGDRFHLAMICEHEGWSDQARSWFARASDRLEAMPAPGQELLLLRDEAARLLRLR